MIEKITPAGIRAAENTVKTKPDVIQSTSADTASDTQDTSKSQSVKNIKNYGSVYLKARDTQANISYMQARADALQTVNGKLQQLKNIAYQYESAKERTLAEQDTIVAGAEQTLYAIDKYASSAQFMGSQLISDAASTELGLDVINLESGGAQAQIDNAIRQVTAKIAMNNAHNIEADVRLNNLEKYSKTSNGYISQFQAEQTAESLVNAMDGVSTEDLYAALDSSKISTLIG